MKRKQQGPGSLRNYCLQVMRAGIFRNIRAISDSLVPNPWGALKNEFSILELGFRRPKSLKKDSQKSQFLQQHLQMLTKQYCFCVSRNKLIFLKVLFLHTKTYCHCMHVGIRGQLVGADFLPWAWQASLASESSWWSYTGIFKDTFRSLVAVSFKGQSA